MQVMSYIVPTVGIVLCIGAIFHPRCNTQSRSNAFFIHLGLFIWWVSICGVFEKLTSENIAVGIDILLLVGNVYIINSCMIRDMKRHYSMPKYDRRHN